jgi:CSLREA domain-containing protein
MPRRAALLALLAAVLIAPAAAHANTFTVNAMGDHAADSCDGDCTLRDAIAAANASSDTDTIVVPAGNYTVNGDNGAYVISNPVTITGPATAQPTAILTSDYQNRVFDVTGSGITVTISHLRVYGGQSPDTNGGSGLFARGSGATINLDHDVWDHQSNNLSGGAILQQTGALNISDSEILNATAYRGGGLFISAGTATVTRTLWMGNGNNTGGGGAIYNQVGFLEVSDSTFIANTINAGHGGAIYASASTSIRDSTFSENVASGNNGGGSAIWFDTTPSLRNNLFGPSGYQDSCAHSASYGIQDLGGNLDAGSSCLLAGANSNQTILLGPLVDNGGATRSLLPWANSAGHSTGANCLATDQRGVARNPDVCDTGAVEGFSGSIAPAPGVDADVPTDGAPENITLHALIDRQGLGSTYSLEYGTTTAYGTAIGPYGVPVGNDAGPQPSAVFIESLTPGTTYHYRFFANSAGGTTTGADHTFRTTGAPAATTQAASAITASSSTLNGLVNSAGEEATWHFEYGPTAAYGSSTAPASAAAAWHDQGVQAPLSGLAAGQTIHYRVVVTNADGTATGDDVIATTTAPQPQPQPQPQPTPSPTATPTPTPTPTPVYGKTTVITPVSGTVLVKLKGAKTFTPVNAITGIALGSTVDVKKGAVQLTTVGKDGKPQTATFSEGIFLVTQSGSITDLELVEALAACPKPGKAASAASKPKERHLWGNGKGAFRTRGQYSAATVRGTHWLVQDTCAGTLTRVVTGIVSVRDNVKHKTITLRAGKRYTARPKRR